MPLYPPASPIDLWIGPALGPMAAVSAVWTANQARFHVFQVNRSVTVSNASYRIGAQAGNIDAGIYDASGNRLASTGTTACPAPGVTTTAFTAPVTLAPGVKYYAAFAVSDGTTCQVGMATTSTLQTVAGYVRHGAVSASMPLPATVTLPVTELASPFYIQFS